MARKVRLGFKRRFYHGGTAVKHPYELIKKSGVVIPEPEIDYIDPS
jgi:hypothetical protein